MARVLFVEDDEVVRGIVTAHLQRAGHQVLAASTVAETMAATEGRPAADVAVLDVGLPDGDGLSLMSQLRARPGAEGLPVIFLSGRVQPDEVEAGRGTGARYLTKPFVASALLAHIERSLAEADSGGW